MSPPTILIAVEDPAWTGALPDVEERCRAAALAALAADPAALPEGAGAEVSLLLADDDTVRGLNRDWRGKDVPTNVLSFAALDDESAPLVAGLPLLLGDVVLAYGTCAAEAARDGKTLGDHLAHLVVHGVLHLLGYDHEDDEAGAVAMEALETAVLAGLGIADPYAPSPDDTAEGGR